MKEARKLIYWTKEEINTINDFIKKEIPHNEIVKQLQVKFDYRTFASINLKVSRMKQPNAEITNPYFYKKDIIIAMKKDLQTTETINNIAQKYAISLNKSYNAVFAKLSQLSTKMPNRKKRKSCKSESNFITKKVLQKSKPIIEQHPAEIGVDVPHGMTFEGKPKRISLHSDHFRIYF